MSRREFHVSSEARARYRLNETLFELSGTALAPSHRMTQSSIRIGSAIIRELR